MYKIARSSNCCFGGPHTQFNFSEQKTQLSTKAHSIHQAPTVDPGARPLDTRLQNPANPNHMETNQLSTSMPFSSLAGLVRGTNMQTSNFNSLLGTTACLHKMWRKACCSGCSFEVSCSFFPHSYFH